MFLYKSRLPFVEDAKSNKGRYERELREYNKELKNYTLSLNKKLDLLVKKGNTLLRLIPSREDKDEKIKYLEMARRVYIKAEKMAFDSKTKRNLIRAIEQIEKKQRGVFLSNFNFHTKFSMFLIFASFLVSLIFISFNFTGAVVGNAKSDFSILGVLFFIFGLIGLFVYAKSRR